MDQRSGAAKTAADPSSADARRGQTSEPRDGCAAVAEAYLRFVINETETPENVFGAADGVGGWGGWCTCPDGQRYNVGDNGDSCGSLACEGGAAGPCDKFVDASRTGKKATCARTESRPTVFEAELCGWRYSSPPPNHKTTYGCYTVDIDRIS